MVVNSRTIWNNKFDLSLITYDLSVESNYQNIIDAERTIKLFIKLQQWCNICDTIFICRPKSGSMLLYSRKKVRYRRDGYCWKKRKDGKTTREDHMKLKVQGTEVSKKLKNNQIQCIFFNEITHQRYFHFQCTSLQTIKYFMTHIK